MTSAITAIINKIIDQKRSLDFFIEVDHIRWRTTVGLAAVLEFYNVQPGTAAQLKN
jgi:hypothetical protein